MVLRAGCWRRGRELARHRFTAGWIMCGRIHFRDVERRDAERAFVLLWFAGNSAFADLRASIGVPACRRISTFDDENWREASTIREQVRLAN